MRQKSGKPELDAGSRGGTPMACVSVESSTAVSASKAKRPKQGNRSRTLKTSEPSYTERYVRWCGLSITHKYDATYQFPVPFLKIRILASMSCSRIFLDLE